MTKNGPSPSIRHEGGAPDVPMVASTSILESPNRIALSYFERVFLACDPSAPHRSRILAKPSSVEALPTLQPYDLAFSRRSTSPAFGKSAETQCCNLVFSLKVVSWMNIAADFLSSFSITYLKRRNPRRFGCLARSWLIISSPKVSSTNRRPDSFTRMQCLLSISS